MGNFLTPSPNSSKFSSLPRDCSLGEIVGVGTTSEIRACTSPNIVAKCIKVSLVQSTLAVIREDIKQWSELKHPNLARCVGTSEGPEYIHVYLERCCGGNLKTLLKRKVCTLAQVTLMAADLLRGLKYLHERGLVYGVLKPSRVLFQDKKALLADFATRTAPQHEQNVYYLAPEALDGKKTSAGDIWTLGVTLYLAVSGRLPFNGIDREEVTHQILFEEPNWQLLPEEVKPLIQQFLKKDPRDRPTVRQALQDSCLKYK